MAGRPAVPLRALTMSSKLLLQRAGYLMPLPQRIPDRRINRVWIKISSGEKTRGLPSSIQAWNLAPYNEVQCNILSGAVSEALMLMSGRTT